MYEVRLADVADRLEKIDLWKIYFDLEKGCFIEFADEYNEATEPSEEDVLRHAFEVEDNWQRYVPLPSAYDVDEHEIMERFAGRQTDEAKAVLIAALAGTGALRHFRRAVKDLSLEESWHLYRRGEFLELAEIWCRENGLNYKDR